VKASDPCFLDQSVLRYVALAFPFVGLCLSFFLTLVVLEALLPEI
jgi:hypothetical protein